MSYLDFTGFFFPFTAEANVNTDFPGALFASTIAHELSHQRGVAREQEANFTAVLACLNTATPTIATRPACLPTRTSATPFTVPIPERGRRSTAG